MESLKVTQKTIRNYLNECVFDPDGTIDCTHMGTDDYRRIMKEEGWLDEIAYSVGVYGCNGVLFIGHNTGKYYVIVGRSTALFIFR